MTSYVAGVDGGGSRTRVVVADQDGREIATVEGPGSAVHPGAATSSSQVIAGMVRSALAASPVDNRGIRILCAGVAGTGRERERDALREALEGEEIADTVIVTTDADIALADAFGDGPGILLTAGTGSIAFGRGPAGATARAGGWGPYFADEGSGTWIGRRALAIVAASEDGREPETSLTGPVVAATGAGQVDELVEWAASASAGDFARLAPVVLEVAATGDLRANSLVTLAVEELGLHVRALARRLFADERAAFPLALSGGLLSRGSLLRRRLEHRLKSMTPGAQYRMDDLVPARGAVRMALHELAGVAGGSSRH